MLLVEIKISKIIVTPSEKWYGILLFGNITLVQTDGISSCVYFPELLLSQKCCQDICAISAAI